MTATIQAKPATGIGNVEIRIQEYGGAYDGAGSLAHIEMTLDLGLHDAYESAKGIVTAANALRDARIEKLRVELAEVRSLTTKSSRLVASATENLAAAERMPGPYLVVPARMLTPDQKAARADLDFQECATCAAKPGCPTLCASCLHNRAVIGALHAKLEGEAAK